MHNFVNRTFSKKKDHFFGQKISKILCLVFYFIISKVSIRTLNYTNASLISAPVVISYQNVRGALMKCQCCYHDTNNVSKDNRKFDENTKHLSVARLSYQFLFYLI